MSDKCSTPFRPTVGGFKKAIEDFDRKRLNLPPGAPRPWPRQR